eukprot:m.177549 g.177549  ORF g.177549 m.177549 type:complete len:906 (-) comp14372_c0_seq1:229-2946(-)
MAQIASEIRAVLVAAGSDDATSRREAEAWMAAAKAANIQEYLAALSSEMADQTAPSIVRKQAGIQLKNEIYSKDETVMLEKQEVWCRYDQALRDHVKAQAIGTLGTEGRPPSTAAQVIAFVACAELPKRMWPDAIPALLRGLEGDAPEYQRASVLEALGYICEDVDEEFLKGESNNILTAVIHAMRPEEPSTVVVRCAVTALTNALAFCEKNFHENDERDAIMSSICQVAHSDKDIEIKVASLQCINEVVNLYYGLMEPYMMALLEISGTAMVADQHEAPNVVLQGIEFWNTVCDTEDRLVDPLRDYDAPSLRAAQEQMLAETPDAERCFFFASAACPEILPVLLELLITHEEEDDPDQWGPSKAAYVCLDAMSLVCKGDMMQMVIAFVERNVASDSDGGSWQRRDAALMAFASLLNDETDQALVERIQSLMPSILGVICPMIVDASVAVRDTAAFVLGKCVQSAPAVIFHEDYFAHIADAIVTGLGDEEARVATNSCWGILQMAKQAAAAAGPEAETYHLSSSFGKLCEVLLRTADRDDANTANLRPSAYDSLSHLIISAAKDCFPILIELAAELLRRLQILIGQARSGGLSSDGVRQLTEQQSCLLVCIGELVRVLKKENIMGAAQDIMEVILAVLQQSTTAGLSAAKEDALASLGEMVEQLGPDYLEFAEPFNQYIVDSLANSAEYHACAVAVGLVGDICRCVGPAVKVYTDLYMRGLGQAIQDPGLDRSVKPQILACIGDVAMALGPDFRVYFEHSYTILQGAAKLAQSNMSDEVDEDEIDYINDLREACLDGYTGIIVGMKGDAPDPMVVQLIMSKVTDIVMFITEIFKDQNLTDDNIRASLGLVGDLVDIFGKDMVHVLSPQFMSDIVSEGSRSSNQQTRDIAQWTRQKLEAITGQLIQ